MDTTITAEPQSPLALNAWARESLGVASKWARFLAIVGFIGCGFMLLMGLFAGSLFSTAISDMPETRSSAFFRSVGGVGLGIMYAVIAVLYFLPCLYLFRFAEKSKTALLSSSEDILAESMNNLKKMFKFLGWMMIVVLSLYGVLIVCVVILAMIGGISR